MLNLKRKSAAALIGVFSIILDAHATLSFQECLAEFPAPLTSSGSGSASKLFPSVASFLSTTDISLQTSSSAPSSPLTPSSPSSPRATATSPAPTTPAPTGRPPSPPGTPGSRAIDDVFAQGITSLTPTAASFEVKERGASIGTGTGIVLLCKTFSQLSTGAQNSIAAIAFNKDRGIPDWVAYRTWNERAKKFNGNSELGDNENRSLSRNGSDFYFDTDLPADARQAVPFTYSSNNAIRRDTQRKYAKGHLMPSHAALWDPRAQNASFSFANAAPQHPSMNSGVWKQIEGWVSAGAEADKELYVITGTYGTIAGNEGNQTTIGPYKQFQVTIPACFYKIVYQPATEEAIAFLVPNEDTSSGLQWSEYVISVADLEKRMWASATDPAASAPGAKPSYSYSFNFPRKAFPTSIPADPKHDPFWPVDYKWPSDYYPSLRSYQSKWYSYQATTPTTAKSISFPAANKIGKPRC